jgi:transcriptional regulator with XRE-family HTH domain
MKIYWNKESNSKNLIGQRVKELRTERQLSQKALAEQLQLAGYEFSDLTVLRIEQGTRFVPDYEVVALAEYFQVSCEYLLGVKNESEPPAEPVVCSRPIRARFRRLSLKTR